MPINQHSLEKTGEIAVEGGHIHYRLYEPHDPEKARKTPVIFLHGGPGASHTLMYACLGSIADERPSVYYDQLGSYFSPADLPQDLMRLDRFTDELHRLVTALNYDKVIVCGHSWGGTIAADYALSHPDKIESLVLAGPLLSTEKWIDDCNVLLAEFSPDVQETIRRCEAEGTTESESYKKADKLFMQKHGCRLEKWPDAMLKSFAKTNSRIYATMWGPSEFTSMGLLKSLDLFPHLHEIKAATLILCGEFDTATPETMKIAQSLIRNASLAILPNSGHLSFVDGNALFLSEFRSFLDKNTAIPLNSPAHAKTNAAP
jgi:proline-specific peptidase